MSNFSLLFLGCLALGCQSGPRHYHYEERDYDQADPCYPTSVVVVPSPMPESAGTARPPGEPAKEAPAPSPYGLKTCTEWLAVLPFGDPACDALTELCVADFVSPIAPAGYHLRVDRFGAPLAPGCYATTLAGCDGGRLDFCRDDDEDQVKGKLAVAACPAPLDACTMVAAGASDGTCSYEPLGDGAPCLGGACANGACLPVSE